jgi:thymidine kinase
MSLPYNPSIDIVFGPMYSGKCLGEGTPIIMLNGEVKRVEDIQKGDIIMGDDSTPRTILSTTRGVGTLYKIKQKYGESYIVNEEHILSLKCPLTKKIVNVSVYDYLTDGKYKRYTGYIADVEFSEKEVNDPFMMGVCIGNGTEEMPTEYKINSKAVRMRVLDGIIHTSGRYLEEKHMYVLKQKRKDDIVYLCRSLGLLTFTKKKKHGYNIYIKPNGYNPIKVEKIGKGDYYGFTLDGNGLFLLGDFTVTHNTSEVIRRLIIYHEIGMKVLYLNTQLDNRADEPFSTHNETIGKVPFDSVKVKILKDTDVDKYDVIAIDEAQFFGDLKEAVLDWVENKRKIVILAGLNGDFRRQPFGQLNDMIPYADTVTKLSPFCIKCIREKKMKAALFTKRTVENDSEILIGGKESYIPVCRECYK